MTSRSEEIRRELLDYCEREREFSREAITAHMQQRVGIISDFDVNFKLHSLQLRGALRFASVNHSYSVYLVNRDALNCTQ